MQALIDFLIRNLLTLWPIRQVDEWQTAIVTRRGRIVRTADVGYRVVDMAQCWRTLWNMENTLRHTALGVLTSACGDEKYRRIARHRSDVEQDLLRRLRETFAPNGIEVVRVRLTDCVPSDARRHYHDGKVPT